MGTAYNLVVYTGNQLFEFSSDLPDAQPKLIALAAAVLENLGL
jgi:hypothetical protein